MARLGEWPAESQHWATPMARDWKSTSPGAATNTRPLSEQVGATVEQASRGPLNPEWVELLMGFPPGWGKV